MFAEQPPADRHPLTAELVIEVAVSSQMIDRNVKAAKYANAAVPSYWLVDVPARTVEVRTKPCASGYEHCETFHQGASLRCPFVGIPDLDISTLFAGLR